MRCHRCWHRVRNLLNGVCLHCYADRSRPDEERYGTENR